MQNFPDSGEVHVWWATLAALAAHAGTWWARLSNAERAAALRQVWEADRARAVSARGMLRTVMAGYLGIEPASVAFHVGTCGKPVVVHGAGGGPAFSLSHSGDFVLLAVAAKGVSVGIDIEQHRPMDDWPAIAAHHFHPSEVDDLHALEPTRQQAAFFDCWTRKEAVVKATGLGLSQPLAAFRVSVTPGAPVRLLEGAPLLSAPDHWHLQALAVAPGYSACLAVQSAMHGAPHAGPQNRKPTPRVKPLPFRPSLL